MFKILCVVSILMPWKIRRWVLVRVFGYQIDKSASIGLSLIMVNNLQMGPNSRIGHLNVLKGLQRVVLGECASIGRGNWITGYPLCQSKHFAHDSQRIPELVIGRHSAITHRHLIDCTNRILIGEYSTIAGYSSQFLTHSIDIVNNRQDSKGIVIGNYCFVGTGVVVLGGSVLPSRSILGAKSLLNKSFSEELKVYGGVPARAVGDVPASAEYLSREIGFVW